jgi:hypothetical protein
MVPRPNGAYSPQQVAVLYRVFDELCDEATAARSTPLTETESKRFRDQVATTIISIISSGEQDSARIKQKVTEIAFQWGSHCRRRSVGRGSRYSGRPTLASRRMVCERSRSSKPSRFCGWI